MIQLKSTQSSQRYYKIRSNTRQMLMLASLLKLDSYLAQQRQLQRMPALNADDTSAFYQSLNDQSTHLCMKLVILTGLRCRPMRFGWKNLGDVWVIPGEKMKGKRGKTPDFRVPLNTEVQPVIAQAKPFHGRVFFPGIRM